MAVWLGAVTLAAQAQAALRLSEPAAGIFVHLGALEDWGPGNGGDVANLAFVVGRRCVAVIDTGGTPAIGRALRAAVRSVTPLPVCYVINTHAHPDHMLGNSAFVGAQFLASEHFAPMLAARAPYYRQALLRDFGTPLQAIADAATLPEFAGWDGYDTLHKRNAASLFLRLERADLMGRASPAGQ